MIVVNIYQLLIINKMNLPSKYFLLCWILMIEILLKGSKEAQNCGNLS